MAPNKNKLFLLLVILVSIFLYGYNLYATLPFDGDTARDTLTMLELWQNKKITLLGAPLSLGFGTPKEIYFSSLPNYLGLLGLLLARFNPTGASLPNLVLTIMSIPFFWLFIRKLASNKLVPYLATLIYAWNPLTVNQARFFWNPNLIIPLSVFFWYFISLGSYFWAGIVIGVIFNFHYLGIIAGIGYGLYLALKRLWSDLTRFLLGSLIASALIIVFELRNQFHLSRTLLWHLQNSGETLAQSYIHPLIGMVKLFVTQLGLISGDLSYPIIYPLPIKLLLIVSTILIILLLIRGYALWQNHPKTRAYLGVFLLSTLVISLLQMSNFTRYMWSLIPISSWLLAELLSWKRSRLFTILVLGYILAGSLANVWHNNDDSLQTLSASRLNQISRVIIDDDFGGRYNVTESFIGDARFTSLRYFLQKDAQNKPASATDYANLDALYVLTRDEDHALEGGRWEFSATPNLVESDSWSVGELYLVKFTRNN